MDRKGKNGMLCLEFANSRWYARHKPYADPLDDASWRERFSAAWELPRLPQGGDALDGLKSFRETVFEAVTMLSREGRVEPAAIDKINKVLASDARSIELVREDDRYVASTVCDASDLAIVQGEIARSFVELATEKPLDRLRVCANPSCDWVFFDESKSGTRKWCDNRCASLMKVRKHRALKKGAEGPSTLDGASC